MNIYASDRRFYPKLNLFSSSTFNALITCLQSGKMDLQGLTEKIGSLLLCCWERFFAEWQTAMKNTESAREVTQNMTKYRTILFPLSSTILEVHWTAETLQAQRKALRLCAIQEIAFESIVLMDWDFSWDTWRLKHKGFCSDTSLVYQSVMVNRMMKTLHQDEHSKIMMMEI